VKYEVVSKTNFLSLEVFRSALSMVETRKELHQQGIAVGKEFLEKQKERTIETTESTEPIKTTEAIGTTEL
jgi:hypothetical protein